ncbi:DUF2182 domain-containing protein [Mesorhizobium sp. STM 4661]|uniref:copper chaperone n=1 Tax=Mesorhizobium sp. STM 4661 TaxID=1297570 RepID=UPI0002BF78C4|nr:DUF2182 domain-containing protein [Mesorhizobium sp. STM 4661]CCV11602.1 conserved membrane hypothetical protein [Mesorhizobium sp. STM 4661]
MRAATVAWHSLRHLPVPLQLASLAGWLLAVMADYNGPLASLCLTYAPDAGATMARISVAFDNASPLLLLSWFCMLLAMMPPLLGSPLRHVWQGSLPSRRLHAVAQFLWGYAAVWCVAGLALVPISLLFFGLFAERDLLRICLGVAIALAWQRTPMKRNSLRLCRARPVVAEFDSKAEGDPLRFGATHGIWCVGSCWGMMLVPLLAPGFLHTATMVLITFAAVVERGPAASWANWPSTRSVWGGAR